MRFRPGARCVRMCLGFVVTAVSAAGCAPVPDRATQTVDYYTGHAKERQMMLEQCQNNPGEIARSPNCVNAMAAARLAGQGSLRTLPSLQLPQPPSSVGPPQTTSSRSVADSNNRASGLVKED
jgi:hypothetical protein